MSNWATALTAGQRAPPSKDPRTRIDLLEIYCHKNSALTNAARKQGLKARRFTRVDGDLRTAEGQRQLWRIIEEEEPRHIWVSPDCKYWGSFSRFNMQRGLTTRKKILQGRENESPNLSLCNDLYWHQVTHRRHFHMEQPQGSDMMSRKETRDIVWGTLKTVFDMCEVGKLKVGNNYLRKRTEVYTTSRSLHESLDSRYCRKQHEHRPIIGKIRYFDKWISLSSYAARYSLGFARNVVEFFKGEHGMPIAVEELCEKPEDDVESQSANAAEVLKRRRLSNKQSLDTKQLEALEEEKRRKANDKEAWKEIFQKLNVVAPRVGSVVVENSHEVFPKIVERCRKLIPSHVEVCRGTDRFRLPKRGVSVDDLPLRWTIMMHRQSGEIHVLGEPEEWQKLSQRGRIRKSGPAKLCLTVFGRRVEDVIEAGSARPSESATSSGSKRKCLTDGDETEKRAKPDPGESEVTEVPLVGGPPRNVARHGPGFLNLEKGDQEWLARLHHRLGHPSPERLAKYLKTVHAEVKFISGALDMQCDACSESNKGFSSARPSAIHENIGFNHTIGADMAYWTSSKGVVYHFVHFLDEGTLFHVARACLDDAVSQLEAFDEAWLSWAGPPQILYVDPAREYVSDVWGERMRQEGMELRVTAADSHWQLGRVESHGSTLKDMLTRVDLAQPINDATMFKRALSQVCWAKNSLSRIDGFSPEQAVLGVARRLPASVTSDEDATSHSLADSEGPAAERFQQTLELRTAARKAFIEADNSSSLRRALLRRSRPIRHAFEAGDLVLYWRRKGGNLRRERGSWFGPARVVLVEGRNAVWLVHANKLVRASPEQLRAASMREWMSVKDTAELKEPVRDWVKKIGHQDFLELGDEIPEPERVRANSGESVTEPEIEEPSPYSREETPEEEPRVDMEVDGVDVPVPDEGDDEVLFGDTIDFWGNNSEQVWEVDVTPPNQPQKEWRSADEMVLVATEERKKRVEIRLRDLSIEDQHRFAVAKHKEIKAWLNHKTVRRITRGKLPEHVIMRCRWLLTWKNAAGDEPPGDINEHGKKAKARLVIIGWEDPQIDEVMNDAPTLSKDGRQMILQEVASHRWTLTSFDVATAFLHGKGGGRQLGVHPVPEMRDALNLDLHDQVHLDGGAYGRIDAPFLWFNEFRDELLRQGCRQCPLDPCVFAYYSTLSSGELRLEGCLGIHVDDGIGGGSVAFHQMLKRVENRFKFGSFEQKEFTYTGIHFKQWDDGTIEYDQVGYVEKICPINIEKSRRNDPESPVTESERTKFRSLIGALQYAAVHSRPDMAAKVGELQMEVTRAKIKDLIQANKTLFEAKQNPVSLMVLPIAPDQVTFSAFSDASFSTTRSTNAHQGTLIFATTPELLANEKAVVAPVAWMSKKVPRVVRSTLGAEAAALSNSLDRLMWIRVLWCWLNNPQCQWHDPEKLLQKGNTASLVTDCKSAYDLLTRTAVPQCAEHRTTIECLLMRERLYKNCTVRWVSTQAMLADCLTKSMDSTYLRECLRTGRYSLRDEQGLLKERSDKKQRLQWVKQQKCMPSDCEQNNAAFVEFTPKAGDFWKVGQQGELIRVHVQPRLQKYTPIGDLQCPVDLREIETVRMTERKGFGVEKDFWVGTLANQKYAEPWTGTTTFFKKKIKWVWNSQVSCALSCMKQSMIEGTHARRSVCTISFSGGRERTLSQKENRVCGYARRYLCRVRLTIYIYIYTYTYICKRTFLFFDINICIFYHLSICRLFIFIIIYLSLSVYVVSSVFSFKPSATKYPAGFGWSGLPSKDCTKSLRNRFECIEHRAGAVGELSERAFISGNRPPMTRGKKVPLIMSTSNMWCFLRFSWAFTSDLWWSKIFLQVMDFALQLSSKIRSNPQHQKTIRRSSDDHHHGCDALISH